MRLLPPRNASVRPGMDEPIKYKKNSTLLSSSIEADIQTFDQKGQRKDSTRCKKKFFFFFPFKSTPSPAPPPLVKQLEEIADPRRKSVVSIKTDPGIPTLTQRIHPDPSRAMEESNEDLRRILESTRVELARSIEKERLTSCLLSQKLQFEAMLTEAISAANASRIMSEEIAAKLACQSKISADLEDLVHTTRSEMDHIRNISANTAHDLKSPLHILIAGIDSMRGMDASDNNQETIDCLDSACAFMQSAISRAMDYSLISGGVGLVPSNCSFNLLLALNNPIKWMGTMIAADGRIKIVLNPLPEGIENIISDRHWVEENLLCLLSNAVKYSNRGTISISVTVSNNNIRVTVADMGIGISAESKPLLFKQFSKLQNMASGSTGLGLFSLLKRSEAMDGSCGVHDRSDGTQGSAFWFEFPFITSKESSSIHVPRLCVSTRGSNRNSFSARPGLTVLIVDDSPMIIKFLTKTLIRMGHRVISACNGADGLEKMIEKKNKIDLVIMDLQMPVMDGIEATRRFRELESLDRTRNRLCIVCSSANSHIEAEALAIAAGVDSFLPKPFDITKFSSLIASIQLNDV